MLTEANIPHSADPQTETQNQTQPGAQGGAQTGTEPADTPTVRILMVADAIGLHGPVTLNRLAEILPIPRPSIWRAASVLRSYGWVRTRLGDNAFELSSRFDFQLAQYHFAAADVEAAASLLERILADQIYHAELGQFVQRGQFVIVESSSREAVRDKWKSLLTDQGALAAQIACDPRDLARHLAAYGRLAEGEELRALDIPGHTYHLDRLRKAGVVWDDNATSASLPWIGSTGTCGAVTISLRAPSRRAIEQLRELVADLLHSRADIPDLRDQTRTDRPAATGMARRPAVS